MQEVDRQLLEATEAFDSDSLPDIGYYDIWESGGLPFDAVLAALEEAGYPLEMLEDLE